MMNVCVVGLGKIGLPLACAIASAGHRVRGADIDVDVVDTVNAGGEPFPGETGLRTAIETATRSGSLIATTDTAAAVRQSEVVVVVVPLVVDRKSRPDYGAIDAATDAIGGALVPGTLVSYETTLPVGTTRQRFTPALEALSGTTSGDDLFVVHSPERVFSGRIFADLRQYPKLVGGVDAPSGARAVDFYESFLRFDERPDLAQENGVWDLGSAEAAELAKLAETTYRDINIAFANELAVAASTLGADARSIIDACNSQPFSHIHSPGISVGGHCIPVYPHFLLSSVDGLRLPALAREVNDAAPRAAVDAVETSVGTLERRRVLVLGLSYRPGVKEHAFSGTFGLVSELERRGASVGVHDPLYSDAEIAALGLAPATSSGAGVDAVILHTDHAEYGALTLCSFPGVTAVHDGRGLWDPSDFVSPGVVFTSSYGSP